MKKTLALLMTLAMVLSCMIGFSVNSGAEVAYVEETYEYKMAMLDDFGNVDDYDQNMDSGAYESVDGFYFGDVWTYEYYNSETEEFLPMTGFMKTGQDGFTPKNGNMYVPYGEVGYSETGLTYIGIWNKGNYLHPGKTGGPVITFIAPASGTISYDVGVRNTSVEGNYATLWLNDDMIWPKNGDMDSAIFNATNSADPDIFQLSCPSFKVEEGDLVRLCITTLNGNRNGKGTTLVEQPVVTYHEASVPIGNPDGTPPANVVASRVSKDTSDTEVTWEEARGAVGYNVYVKASTADGDPVKVNDKPITELKYTVTGLDYDTLYEATVTSITAEGKESVASDPAGFKTPKGDGKTSDKTSDKDTDTSDATNVPATNNNNNNNNKPGAAKPSDNSILPIILIVAGVVVVAVVIVLVLVLGKKKKKTVEAAPAVEVEAAPVEESAPVEEPAEETPAEEEKKDEE